MSLSIKEQNQVLNNLSLDETIVQTKNSGKHWKEFTVDWRLRKRTKSCVNQR